MITRRSYVSLLFILYIGLFLYAVFMQSERKEIDVYKISDLANFIPFKNTVSDIYFLFQHGIIGNMNLVLNIIVNVILFLPIPFFLTEIFHLQRMGYVLLTGFLVSIWVECMQYVLILGISDIDDVLLNLLGTYCGRLIINKIIF